MLQQVRILAFVVRLKQSRAAGFQASVRARNEVSWFEQRLSRLLQAELLFQEFSILTLQEKKKRNVASESQNAAALLCAGTSRFGYIEDLMPLGVWVT